MAFVSPRKVLKAKHVLQNTRPDNLQGKSVTFSDDTIETSIGGTQRVGKIKKDLLLHFDTTPFVNGTPKMSAQRSAAETGMKAEPVSDSKEDKEVDLAVKKSRSAVIKTEPASDSKENKEAGLAVKKSKPAEKDGPTTNLSNNSSTLKSDTFQSPVTQLRASNGKSRSKSKPSTDKLDTPKTDFLANKTPRLNRNSKDFLGSNDNLFDKKDSEAGTPRTSDNLRTTLDRIDTVALTPFQAPEGKYARRHTLESKLFSTPDCFHDVSFARDRLFGNMIQEEHGHSLADGEDSCSVTVAVRVRPFSERELRDSNVRCAVAMQGNETTVISDTGATHRFMYDFSFWSHDQGSGEYCDQEAVYARLAQPLLGKAFEGYNTCLFAYGQTGSGKSYSILGSPSDVGIIPRFCSDLFSRADMLTTKKKVKVKVEISFFEIYQEKIHDLLASTEEKGAKKITLDVREHPVLGPYVEGLSTYVVNSFEEVKDLITKGGNNRFTAATEMNLHSSRSHSVFTLVLSQTKIGITQGQEHELCVNSKINLVDLAGSERQSSANTSGERLREGAYINKSLLTLGKVISLLCDRSQSNKKGKRKKEKMYIPYRDSLLTWLLKESLGGNSKTAMIATISPSNQHMEETLSTLRYAQQARSIVNVVRINEVPKDKLIRQLLTEIERLRAEQKGTTNEDALAASTAEIARLKFEMEELRRSLEERLREAETKKADDLKAKEKSGMTFKVDNTLPSLVNLNEDLHMSESLLHVIKEGETRVGRNIVDSDHDIKLSGALIAKNHCFIRNKNNTVELTPIGDAPTYVNGNLLKQAVVLHHGDRVILGSDHYFRFNHPVEVQRNREGSNSDIKDFEFAKEELQRVQKARMQELLQVELEKSRQEILKQRDGYEIKLKGLESALTQVKQSNKEAQVTINNLKQQNLMLEKEVLDEKNREKMEKSQKWDDWSGHLATKIDQTRQRLEYLRKKKEEMAQAMPDTLIDLQVKSMGSIGSRRELLYSASLLVREANKISQKMNSHLTFSKEYALKEAASEESDPEIRVVNMKHRMFTIRPLSEFKEKLAMMRQAYKKNDSSGKNDVFNDSEGTWEKEPTSLSSRLSANGVSSIASINELPRTPVYAVKTEFMTYSPRSTEEIEMSLVKALKYLLSSTNNTLTATEESPIDKVLVICQRIKQNIQCVTHTNSAKSKKGMGTNWSQPLSIVVVDVHTLALLTTQWCSIYGGVRSPSLQDILDRSAECVNVIRRHASSMLQGCESQLISLTSENGHKLNLALSSLCESCGELALATQTKVLRIGQSELQDDQHKLTPDTIASFIAGCTRLATKTLEDSIESLGNLERKCEDIASDGQSNQKSKEMLRRLKHVLSCVEALVQKTIQEGLALGALLDGNQRPPQFYKTVYERLQKIVSTMTSVVDSSRLLLVSAESIVQGSTQDTQRLQKCTEKILQHCQQLMPALSLTYVQPCSSSVNPTSGSKHSGSLSSTGSWSSVSSASDMSQSQSPSSDSPLTSNSDTTSTLSDLTEVSFLSESQLSFLDSAVQEVAMATSLFSEYLGDTWSIKPGSIINAPDIRKPANLNQVRTALKASKRNSCAINESLLE